MEADVRNTTFAEVETIAADLGLPIYWPNVAVPTNPADEHLRCSITPTNPETIKTTGRARRVWILQISVYVRDGVGDIKPAQHIDNIENSLEFGDRLTINSNTFEVISNAEIASVVALGGWSFYPVQFRLRSFEV